MSMAAIPGDSEDEYEPRPDFSDGAFTTLREPMRELINTFSEMYVSSDGERKVEAGDCEEEYFFPPPPSLPEMRAEDGMLPKDFVENFTKNLTTLEEQLGNCMQKVGICINGEQLEARCRAAEDKLSYHIRRTYERVQKDLEVSIQEMGKSMVDCLKRRYAQIDRKIAACMPPASSPVAHFPDAHSNTTVSQGVNRTYQLQGSHVPFSSNTSCISHRSPVNLEFPRFGADDTDDPITYIEKCEEYLSLHHLCDTELFATLSSVLKGTAKAWWMAERRNVNSWDEFKKVFLKSFLAEDYEAEAERCLRERRQGSLENILDFAYQYRALCLRYKKDVTEKEIVTAILQNCNPRLQ